MFHLVTKHCNYYLSKENFFKSGFVDRDKRYEVMGTYDLLLNFTGSKLKISKLVDCSISDHLQHCMKQVKTMNERRESILDLLELVLCIRSKILPCLVNQLRFLDL